MELVTHDGLAEQVDPEEPGLKHKLIQPYFPMIVVLSRNRIIAQLEAPVY